ncbi:MAG: hypothetical protein GVY16_01850 [Planctomycetes bacterium]|jgi:hypothetical protein|nr:hypothetical protein [Planctomycetota bacterium]
MLVHAKTISTAMLMIAAAGLLGLLVYTTSADAQARRIGVGGRPVELVEVQISGSDEAMAVLDPDQGVLLVLRWDAMRERPVAIGARDLTRDFENSGARNYSMRAAANSSREDLLYVTDNDNRLLRVYRMDERAQRVEPVTEALPLVARPER